MERGYPEHVIPAGGLWKQHDVPGYAEPVGKLFRPRQGSRWSGRPASPGSRPCITPGHRTGYSDRGNPVGGA